MQAFLSLTDILGESSIHMYAHTVTIYAESNESGLAETTMAAGKFECLGGYPISNAETRNFISCFNNNA